MRLLHLPAVLVLLAVYALSVDGASPSPTVNVQEACFPTNEAGPLPDVPCWLADQLSNVCVYGNANGGGAENGPQKSSADQQDCFCKGQGAMYFQYFAGCSSCQLLHGDSVQGQDVFPPPYVTALSSSYCVVATPTVPFLSFYGTWKGSSTISLGTSTGGVDVLGTLTEVNLYFTPSPVGSPPGPVTTAVGMTTASVPSASAGGSSAATLVVTTSKGAPGASTPESTIPAAPTTTPYSSSNGAGGMFTVSSTIGGGSNSNSSHTATLSASATPTSSTSNSAVKGLKVSWLLAIAAIGSVVLL